MSEKPEEDFDEEAEDLAGGDEGLDLDHIMRDLDTGKKRGKHAPVGEPAWRRLERLREDRRTTQLLSDFDDYDVGDDEPSHSRPRKPARGKHRD